MQYALVYLCYLPRVASGRIALQADDQDLIFAELGQAAVIILSQPDFFEVGRCRHRRRCIQNGCGWRDGQDAGERKQARAKNQAGKNGCQPSA